MLKILLLISLNLAVNVQSKNLDCIAMLNKDELLKWEKTKRLVLQVKLPKGVWNAGGTPIPSKKVCLKLTFDITKDGKATNLRYIDAEKIESSKILLWIARSSLIEAKFLKEKHKNLIYIFSIDPPEQW